MKSFNIFLQVPPVPTDALNNEISGWIITVLLISFAGLLWLIKKGFVWGVNKFVALITKGATIFFTKLTELHREGIDELKAIKQEQIDIKSTQKDILAAQAEMNINHKNNVDKVTSQIDGLKDQVKEVRFSQLTMAKNAVKIMVTPEGKEEIDSLEKDLEKKKRKRDKEEKEAAT